MKKLFSTVLLISLLTTTTFASDFQLNVGGATVGSSQLIFNKDKRVMIPVKTVANNLGYTVSYDKKTKTVNLTNSIGNKVSLTDGQRYAIKDSTTVTLPAATMQKNGSAYMSFAGIRQVFSSEITWDTNTRTVFITPLTGTPQQQTQLPAIVQSGNYNKYGAVKYKEERLVGVKDLADKAKSINDSEVVLAKDGKVVQSIRDIGVFLLTEISSSTLESIDEIVVLDHTNKVAYTTGGLN